MKKKTPKYAVGLYLLQMTSFQEPHSIESLTNLRLASKRNKAFSNVVGSTNEAGFNIMTMYRAPCYIVPSRISFNHRLDRLTDEEVREIKMVNKTSTR